VSLPRTRVLALARKYHLTEEDFNTLLDACDHRCPLCGRPFTKGRPPVVDHEHALPMRVRGLLCSADNWLLGTRSENPEFYQAIANYLLSPPAFRLSGPPRHHGDAPTLE
jgi:recombination endonuclease VII